MNSLLFGWVDHPMWISYLEVLCCGHPIEIVCRDDWNYCLQVNIICNSSPYPDYYMYDAISATMLHTVVIPAVSVNHVVMIGIIF